MTPFFSIIIPLFNSARCVNDALESIKCQTFDDYEIILIDGLSTDDTLQLIESFKKANPLLLVKLLSEKDKGIYDAMNKGIALATGDWLYFMGSDDKLHSANVLLKINQALNAEKVNLIYGNVVGLSGKKRYVYDTIEKVLSTGIHHQSVFYSAALFKKLGNYSLQFKIAADYEFTLKVFLDENFRVKYINEDIAYYGEAGYSSQNFDYPFFSTHYRILSKKIGIKNWVNLEPCLDRSIYCCLYLGGKKKAMGLAWRNLLYYITAAPGLTLGYRIKTGLRMLSWSIKPANRFKVD